jgi:diacylglycerol kinase (ATP)
MRIDVIVNRTARLHVTRPRLTLRMRQVCEGTAEIHETSSVAQLTETARKIARRGTDLVILSGGDGSFMAGVTELARAFGEQALPAFAFVPGGTAATVARNWGMRGDPAELLAAIIARKGLVPATLRPTLRVRSTTGGVSEERLGFIFGTGLVAKFFEKYYQDGGRGYASAARMVARIFAESFYGGSYARSVLDPLPCSIMVEGRPLEPDAWSLVCAAVVRDLGIHMLVTYRAGEDPERPHLVASALRSHELGPRAPLVLAGKRIGGPGHFDDLVREFAIHFSSPGVTNGQQGHGGTSGGPFVLDGDMLRADSVHVTAGPRISVAHST